MHIFALFRGCLNRMVGVDIVTRPPIFGPFFGPKWTPRDPHELGGLGWPFSSGNFGFFLGFSSGAGMPKNHASASHDFWLIII